MDEISSGIVIKRVGDAHPQGREEVTPFEYREGQPLAAFYGGVLEQLLMWAQESHVDLQTLASETPVLRRLVQLTGGKITAGAGN